VNDILKQRLVGALILLALGVVFWPIIFVQPENKGGLEQHAFPQAPSVATEPVEAPGPAGLRASPEAPVLDQVESDDVLEDDGEPEVVAAAEPVSSAAGPSTGDAPAAGSEVRSQPPQPLKMDAEGVPVAWTLQVATVSSAEKAETLRKRLIAMNEKAYVTTVSSGGNRLYRVSVGPKFERAELERVQSRINAEFGVKTLIVRYLP